MGYQPGDVIAGKYRIIESVGGGAMGQVFKAEHILIQKVVAIKILHHDIGENNEMVQRFRREAQAAAVIDHPNICSVMDFDTTENGEFYLVMEYLEGETLQKRIYEKGIIPPSETIFIMKQLLDVLQCAHDNGIVHRDIKPENVTLISKDGTDDFVKLLDFGIAHREEISTISQDEDSSEFKTKAGFLYGTPEYIAPEQANGLEIDHRVDLYACGVTLYQMLMGHVPFTGNSIIAILHDQVCTPPPHIDVEHIECGAQFDAIIQKLMAKDPGQRFQSALSVIEALDLIPIEASGLVKKNHPSGQSIPAPPDVQKVSAGVSEPKPVARYIHPTMVIVRKVPAKLRIIIAAAVLLLTGGVIAIVFVSSASELPEVEISENGEITEPQTLKEVSDIQPFIYDNDQFTLSDDETLRKDPNLFKASEAFHQQDYLFCYENIDAVEDRYHKHPNYLRFRMQSAKALAQSKAISKDSNRFAELMQSIVKDFIALTKLVPDAGRNGAVRSALAMALTDIKNKYESEEAFSQLTQNPHKSMAKAIAWTIIYSPYDSQEAVKKRLFEVYDALPSDKIPEWQKQALEAWRLEKSKCQDRKDLIQAAFQTNASRKDLYYGLLVPLYQNLRLNIKDKRKRMMCKANLLQVRDCNHCMKPWIESGYEDWTKRIEDGTIEKAPLPFE